MHLRGGEPDAARVLHGLEHVGDQAPDLGMGRVGDRFRTARENGVTHGGRS